MHEREKIKLEPNRVIGNNRKAEVLGRRYFRELMAQTENPPTERDPSLEEKALTEVVIKVVANAIQTMGYSVSEYPFSKIHFVDEGSIPPQEGQHEDTLRVATTDSLTKDIVLATKQNDLNELAHTLVHELLHVHSFSSIVAIETTASKRTTMSITERRGGFTFTKKKKTGDYTSPDFEPFHYLNEAVIEQLAIYIIDEYFPKFENLKSITVDPEDSYAEERICFEKLIDALFKANRDTYPLRETIVDLFLDATFKGNVLGLARLIENTYGKGSFRDIGERFSSQPVEIDDILKRVQIT